MEAVRSLPISSVSYLLRGRPALPSKPPSNSNSTSFFTRRKRRPSPAGSAPARGPRESFRISSNVNGEKADESRFFDEDGVVEDMDGYLNYLSLEYDSVWDTKPSWCQPWTILLTGVAVVACSWTILHSAAISVGLSILICGWWYIFLYAYPKAYSNMIAERRKRVSSGIEDTFEDSENSTEDQ
ncbi:uncharacterized protein LOC135634963 isoform X1 [Musa acuminata AAA Group]|uniref:uncharacterized protein LOC135634963 isoform X1 n=1 Tax=Musa acuminata AAA Group TaxID=214697 RepID=UPI0031CF64DA